jgi:hypothetical protein
MYCQYCDLQSLRVRTLPKLSSARCMLCAVVVCHDVGAELYRCVGVLQVSVSSRKQQVQVCKL